MENACAILSSVTFLALQYFPSLFHKRNDFRKKVNEHKICVSILSTTCVRNIFHSKRNWTRYVYMSSCKVCLYVKYICLHVKYICLHVKYPLFLSDFIGTWILTTDFGKIHKYKIFWKFALWRPSCFMRTDRHDESISRFSLFCERA
jgi:hypothetical protein